MKLLLKDDVKNLGHAGEVVTVRDGYGRNFLVPQGYAVQVTPGNLKVIEAEKKRLEAMQAEKIAGLRGIAEKIAAAEITLTALVSEGENLYGAVQVREMADALQALGISIDPDCIQPSEPVKTLGVHRVPVKLHSQVVAELKVWVNQKAEEANA